MTAFQNSVYALARTSPAPNCATCHSAIQAPLFAAADPNVAYLAALTQVNFANIPTSLLAFYAGNSHCGNVSQCGSFTAQMTAAIQAWAAVEAPAPSPSPSPMPSTTPSSSPPPSGNYWDGVTLRDGVETLRKASFQLLGRPPTAAEIAQVNPNDLSTLDPVLMNMMADPTFKDRIIEIFNDVFLTESMRQGFSVVHEILFAFGQNPTYDQRETSMNIAIAKEPMEYIAHVVMNNRPFTEIVNGQYRLLNKDSASLFGLQGKITTSTFQEYAGPELKQGPNATTGEYAGILSTHSYEKRYTNTQTNRNRKRARYALKNFLGLDVMLLSPPNLDTSKLTPNTAPWKTNPQCTACHQVLDPVAGLFMNWTKGVTPGTSTGENYYFIGSDYFGRTDWWYPYVYQQSPASNPTDDMFLPGFGGQNLGTDTASKNLALAFLGQKIAADPRFPTAMVQHVFRGLTGVEPLPPSAYVDGVPAQEAADAQASFFTTTGQKMAANGFNLKTAFIEVIKSGWFRAKNVSSANRPELIGVGGGVLTTPEVLSKKIIATYGSRWTGNGFDLLTNVNLTSGEADYVSGGFSLFYGGIDSDSVTKRTRLANGLTVSIAERMALQMSCRTVAADFLKAAASRTFFPDVQLTELPGTTASDADIKANIQYLHRYLLGEDLAVTDPEILATYQLLSDSLNALKTAGASKALGDCASGTLTTDTNYMVQAWQAVLVYLTQDYKFLIEN
jgi:hypothetical protein